MIADVRIAVVGVGLIGQRHTHSIDATKGAKLACMVDPSQAGREFAKRQHATWFASLAEMFVKSDVDGVIIATPNQNHVVHALDCVSNGYPVLVEKPIGTSVAEAEKLVSAADSMGVPILTGHHRRHNPIIQKAKSIIDDGTLGTVVSIQGTCWVYKPDDYFDIEWRRRPGGGPVYINLIHDIDIIRHLCGEIESVHALESNMIRNNKVEETTAILLRFHNGALGTMNVSDTIVAPWSWELTARENPVYAATSEGCYMIGGTRASLSLPNLTLWSNEGDRSWWNPISGTKMPLESEDPLVAQIRQFAAVIRGEQAPLVSGDDGLRTLRVIEAVKNSAATGETVAIAA